MPKASSKRLNHSERTEPSQCRANVLAKVASTRPQQHRYDPSRPSVCADPGFAGENEGEKRGIFRKAADPPHV